MTTSDAVFIPQIDLDLIKSEETNPLLGLGDCLAPPPAPDKDARADRDGDIMVCCICLSASGVSSLKAEHEWLHVVTRCDTRWCRGVCVACAGPLRRATLLVTRVQEAENILRRVEGEIDINSINILKLHERPLVELSTKHISPEHYDKFFAFEEEIESSLSQINDLKDDNKIKIENNFEPIEGCYDENDMFNSSDDEPIKKEIKHTNKDSISKTEGSEPNVHIEVTTKPVARKPRSKPIKLKTKNKAKIDETIEEKPKEISKIKTRVLNKKNTKTKPTEVGKQTRSMEECDKLINKYFETKILTLEEQRENFVKSKMSKNYETAPFKCELCFTGFDEESLYDKHVAEKCKTRDPLSCPVCAQACSSARGLGRHLWGHSRCATYKCNVCDFKTIRKPSAKIHAGMHDGNSFVCNVCGQAFGRRPSYLTHMRIKHPSDAVCALCGFSFLGERGLYYHRRLAHRGEDHTVPADAPRCAECELRFVSAEALAAHRRVSPRHEKCSVNDLQRERLKAAKAALEERGGARGRAGRKPAPLVPRNLKLAASAVHINCEQCGAAQSSAVSYRLHFAKFHSSSARTDLAGVGSLCFVCGVSVKNLTLHMEQHTPGPGLRCGRAGCDKTFRTKTQLRNHAAVHREPKYECPTCGKRFNHRSNFNRHFTYVHSSVRDVRCEFCEKSFKSRAEQSAHAQFVHRHKPWPRKRRAPSRDPRPV